MPAPDRQEALRAALRVRWPAAAAKPDPKGDRALAESLAAAARSDAEPAELRYVLAAESAMLAARAGDMDLAVRVCRDAVPLFGEDPVAAELSSSLARGLGAKARTPVTDSVAALEVAGPVGVNEVISLTERWQEVAASAPVPARHGPFRRSRTWGVEASGLETLRGDDARARVHRLLERANAEIDAADARAGRFTVFAGRWIVRAPGGPAQCIDIGDDGALTVVAACGADGAPSGAAFAPGARLVRRGGAVVAPVPGEKRLQRIWTWGDSLRVQPFDAGARVPESWTSRTEATCDRQPAGAAMALARAERRLAAGRLDDAEREFAEAAKLAGTSAAALATCDRLGADLARRRHAESVLAKAADAPAINRRILEFALARMGEQVGNGECWTFADHVLREAGAAHPDVYVWGTPVPRGERVYPGDVVQLEQARFESAGNASEWALHTAIVCTVTGSTQLTILHQNTADLGKRVGETGLDLAHLVRGRVTVFRPQPAAR